MKKEVQVHKVLTEDYSNLTYCKNNKKLLYDPSSCKHINGQHLHFTIDDQPEEGDWKIVGNLKITKHRKGDFLPHYGIRHRKIIATTDKSLMIQDYFKSGKKAGLEQLPQIPQWFVEEYVKQDGIDKVLVEYVKELDSLLLNRENSWIPRVTSNNEVIVSLVEEKRYSTEEVKELLKKYGTFLWSKNEELDDWSKENL